MSLILVLEKKRNVALIVNKILKKQEHTGYFVTKRKRLVEVLKEDIGKFKSVIIVDDNLDKVTLKDYIDTIKRWLKYKGDVYFMSSNFNKLWEAQNMGYLCIEESFKDLAEYAKSK